MMQCIRRERAYKTTFSHSNIKILTSGHFGEPIRLQNFNKGLPIYHVDRGGGGVWKMSTVHINFRNFIWVFVHAEGGGSETAGDGNDH